MIERYETLARLAVRYCKLKSLDIEQYFIGMGEVPEKHVDTLIRYHTEWMR